MQPGVAILGHHEEMKAERLAVQHALTAFDGQLTPRRNGKSAESEIHVGIFGLKYDPLTVKAFQKALEDGKHCLMLLKTINGGLREPALTQFIESHPEIPRTYYNGLTDLVRRVIQAIESLSPTLFPGWRIPTLPLRDDLFVGREDALQVLNNTLRDNSPLVVTGATGIGKTSLVREFVHRTHDRFPGGIFWLDAGYTVQQALFKLSQAHPEGRSALAEEQQITPLMVKKWLAQAPGRGLVVIDDSSHIEHWQELQNALPANFKLLVTGTQPIEKSDWYNHTVSELSSEDCLVLLSKALDVPPNLPDEMLSPLNEVAATLKNHPMSLRMAVVWLQRFGGWRAAMLYTGRLSETYNVFQNLDLESPRYRQTEKAFSLIYRTFNKEQKQLFQACGTFAPGSVIPLPALIEISGIKESTCLNEGMMPGLMTWDAANEGYRLNDLLHRYAEALLQAQPDSKTYYQNHLDYYEREAGHRTPQNPPDFSQYRRAFHFALQHAPEHLMPFVISAGSLFTRFQQTDELREWLNRTLNIPISDDSAQASVVRALGDLSTRIDHTTAAQAYYERALLLYYQNKSLSGQANTLKALGDLSVQNHDVRSARDYYNKALALYQQIDFQLGKASTFKALGDLSREENKPAQATEFYEKALPIYNGIGIHLETADIHVALAALNPENAIEHYEQALARYQKINNAIQAVHVLTHLAKLHRQQDETPEAEKALAGALALCHHHHLWMETAQVQYLMGELQAQKGDIPGGIQLILQALDAFEEHNMIASIEQARTTLRSLAGQHRTAFEQTWKQVKNTPEKPDWLTMTQPMPVFIPPELIYAVRDFMLIDDPKIARHHVEENRDLLLSDSADEVFSRMLRQYAGQTNPTRQIDKYRALLQRCRQVGIDKAFEEFARHSPETPDEIDPATRLTQTLDAYHEALDRLRDMPLVYASIQINRAGTLRELAEVQDYAGNLKKALEAYEAALEYQQNTPLDYARTQISRAEVLRLLAELPEESPIDHLKKMLAAYAEALQAQKHIPIEYARTQMQRASALHRLSQFENAHQHMKEALSACNEAIISLKGLPPEYARAQSQRAQLLYEMAGLPGEDFKGRMWEALQAYDEALEYQRDEPIEYAKTQSRRVALLRDMAGLPGEDRTARLYQALAASNEALRYLLNAAPLDYARTQVNRGFLLREIAGLEGEHRLARMREAIAAYNDALDYLKNLPLDYANTQTSRAALLRELALLSGENQHERLRQGLEASSQAVTTLEKLNNESQLRIAQRVMLSIKQEIVKRENVEIFNRLWNEVVGTPQPEWLNQ